MSQNWGLSYILMFNGNVYISFSRFSPWHYILDFAFVYSRPVRFELLNLFHRLYSCSSIEGTEADWREPSLSNDSITLKKTVLEDLIYVKHPWDHRWTRQSIFFSTIFSSFECLSDLISSFFSKRIKNLPSNISILCANVTICIRCFLSHHRYWWLSFMKQESNLLMTFPISMQL